MGRGRGTSSGNDALGLVLALASGVGWVVVGGGAWWDEEDGAVGVCGCRWRSGFRRSAKEGAEGGIAGIAGR